MMIYQSDFKRKKKKGNYKYNDPESSCMHSGRFKAISHCLKAWKQHRRKFSNPKQQQYKKTVTQNLSSQTKNVKDISKLIGQTIKSDCPLSMPPPFERLLGWYL